MKVRPQSYVILEGFTDPVGSWKYNLQLSRRRVESVGNYLMTKLNIDQDRIVVEETLSDASAVIPVKTGMQAFPRKADSRFHGMEKKSQLAAESREA